MDKVAIDGSCYVLKDAALEYRPGFIVNEQTDLDLRKPTFNNWLYQDSQLVDLIMHVYRAAGIVDHFKIELQVLYNFVSKVRFNYNNNVSCS
jgi:high affinity cGMP-specific 3',5'-cyclic phosphodiesterase 9